jgi:hypothetical protein
MQFFRKVKLSGLCYRNDFVSTTAAGQKKTVAKQEMVAGRKIIYVTRRFVSEMVSAMPQTRQITEASAPEECF